MTEFNKREFGKIVASRLNVSQAEGMLLFEEIGQRMGQALSAGETVFLFGKGTLKVVKKRNASDQTRIRFRPSQRDPEKGSTMRLTRLSGIASGQIDDAIVVTSVSAGERAINVGRACTVVGSRGQIVVYLGDDGLIRCVISRTAATPEEAILDTKSAARAWLKGQFPLVFP